MAVTLYDNPNGIQVPNDHLGVHVYRDIVTRPPFPLISTYGHKFGCHRSFRKEGKISWSKVHTAPGTFDFTDWDTFSNKQPSGATIELVLYDPPAFARTSLGGDPSPISWRMYPVQEAYLKEFVAAMVQRYPKIKYIDPYNEWNLASVVSGGSETVLAGDFARGTVNDLVNVVRWTKEACLSANRSDIIVYAGSVNSSVAMLSVLDNFPTILNYSDRLAFHAFNSTVENPNPFGGGYLIALLDGLVTRNITRRVDDTAHGWENLPNSDSEITKTIWNWLIWTATGGLGKVNYPIRLGTYIYDDELNRPNVGFAGSPYNRPGVASIYTRFMDEIAGKKIIKVIDNGGLWQVAVSGTTVSQQPPTANAGPDQTIALPNNSVILVGSSNDPEGGVVNYLWTKTSGPSAGTIVDSSLAITQVLGLTVGTYVFRLQVTDSQGLSAQDTVTVKVNPGTGGSNVLPTANAGLDQIIRLPQNSVTLSGFGIDGDGFIISYNWSKISGPLSGTITSPGSPTTTVTGLEAGTYVFRFTVSDNLGGTASDLITIKVNIAAPPPPGGIWVQSCTLGEKTINGVRRLVVTINYSDGTFQRIEGKN